MLMLLAGGRGLRASRALRVQSSSSGVVTCSCPCPQRRGRLVVQLQAWQHQHQHQHQHPYQHQRQQHRALASGSTAWRGRRMGWQWGGGAGGVGVGVCVALGLMSAMSMSTHGHTARQQQDDGDYDDIDESVRDYFLDDDDDSSSSASEASTEEIVQQATEATQEDDEAQEEDYVQEVRARYESRTAKDIQMLKDKYNWCFKGNELHVLDPETSANVVVFSGSSHPLLAQEVCDYLNLPVGRSHVQQFTDGEVLVRINQEIRGRDCFVIIPTNSNDNVIELLLSISAMRRASAKQITAVIPYFGYARQDQRAPFRREPIAAADIARMLEEVGVDRIASVDLHSGQIQGFFSPRVPVDHLTPGAIAAAYFVENVPEFKRAAMRRASQGAFQVHFSRPLVTVVAPHEGQVRRARIFRERLAKLLGSEASVSMALVSKFTSEDGALVRQLIGDVTGRTCILVDDLLDTGKTLVETVDLLKWEGADKVFAFATHARFSEGSVQRVRECRDLEFCVVTNTMPFTDCKDGEPLEHELNGHVKGHGHSHPHEAGGPRDPHLHGHGHDPGHGHNGHGNNGKIRSLSIAPLIAEAIINIHDSGSVSSVITTTEESAAIGNFKAPSEA